MPPIALRLTCDLTGGEIALVAARRVTVVTPDSDLRSGYDGEAGFWCELRDGKGRVLYRRISQNPLTTELEVYGGQAPSHIQTEPHATFEVTVPDLPQAQTLQLVASPPDRPTERATPAAAFALGPVREELEP